MIPSGALAQMGWIGFQNNNGSAVPPFGIMRATGISIVEAGRTVVVMDQPNSYGDPGNCYVNGPVNVASNAYGSCTRTGGPLVALYDSTDGTPLFGDFWGPRNGTWKLKKQTGGFFVLGVSNSSASLALVQPWPMRDFYGQNQGARIGKGTFGTIEVYFRTGGGIIDTGQSLTSVYARFGDIAANAFVQCFYDTSVSTNVATWYAIETDTCP